MKTAPSRERSGTRTIASVCRWTTAAKPKCSTYSHDGKEETVKFYDENGKELTPKEFAHQYRDLIMQYGEQL